MGYSSLPLSSFDVGKYSGRWVQIGVVRGGGRMVPLKMVFEIAEDLSLKAELVFAMLSLKLQGVVTLEDGVKFKVTIPKFPSVCEYFEIKELFVDEAGDYRFILIALGGGERQRYHLISRGGVIDAAVTEMLRVAVRKYTSEVVCFDA